MAPTPQLILILFLLRNCKPFHLTSHAMSWFHANVYCIDICNSSLLSIHDPGGNAAIDTGGGEAWIGLHNFAWSDSSSFDYGTVLSGGIFPWSSGMPSNESCSFMNVNNEWNSVQCNLKKRFLCNNCVYDPIETIETPSYYLSQTELSGDWMHDHFCHTKCDDHAGSILSKGANEYIHYIDSNTFYRGYWQGVNLIIPLYDNQGWNTSTTYNDFRWHDNKPYVYNNWSPGNPKLSNTSKACAAMDQNSGEWYSSNCDSYGRVICPKCYNHITKYLLIDEYEKPFDGQNNRCLDHYGTTTASIHSNQDRISAAKWCEFFNHADCVLGLKDDLWTDGTPLDYGLSDPAISSNCLAIDIDTLEWKALSCSNMPGHILCNAPSEICHIQWWTGPMIGDGSWEFISNSHGCFILNNYDKVGTDYGTSMIILSQKQYINNGTNFIMEYSFIINSINNGNNKFGVILNYESICEYISISVNINNNTGINTIDFDEYYDGVIYNHQSVITNYNFYTNGSFYVMTINSYGTHYRIKINEDYSTEFIISLTNFNLGRLSTFLGLLNKNANITIKSFFISGTVMYLDGNKNNQIFNSLSEQCLFTENPTKNPTGSPTKNPTHNPSLSTTNNPTISPTNVPTQGGKLVDDGFALNLRLSLTNVILILVILVIVLCGCICFILVICKYKKMKTRLNSMGSTTNSANFTSKMEVKESVKSMSMSSGDVVASTKAYEGPTSEPITNEEEIEMFPKTSGALPMVGADYYNTPQNEDCDNTVNNESDNDNEDMYIQKEGSPGIVDVTTQGY